MVHPRYLATADTPLAARHLLAAIGARIGA
jgi:hypothetical protein